jgi:hypothetical protein
VILTVFALTLLAYAPSAAVGDNRVALVVDFGGGVVERRCVSFTEPQITGYQALERSGLPVETDFQAGGAAVCRIDGTGCPANDCFCSCRGGSDCVYWSYWHLVAGAWQYSMGGSGQYMVSDGAIEGWVWGLGSVTQASPPPLVSFAEVCADPVGGASSPTPSLTPIIIRTATPIESNPAQPPTATATTAPTGTPAPTVTAAQPGATTVATTTATAPINAPTASPGGQTTPLAPATPGPTQPAAPVTVGESSGGESTASTATPHEVPATTAPLPPPGTVGPTDAQGYIPPDEQTPELTSSAATAAEPAAPVIAAVVGADVSADSDLAAVPAGQATEAVNPIAYSGFAGLLLLLGALALLVYRRRSGE